jgi:hypothetical protein
LESDPAYTSNPPLTHSCAPSHSYEAWRRHRLSRPQVRARLRKFALGTLLPVAAALYAAQRGVDLHAVRAGALWVWWCCVDCVLCCVGTIQVLLPVDLFQLNRARRAAVHATCVLLQIRDAASSVGSKLFKRGKQGGSKAATAAASPAAPVEPLPERPAPAAVPVVPEPAAPDAPAPVKKKGWFS